MDRCVHWRRRGLPTQRRNGPGWGLQLHLHVPREWRVQRSAVQAALPQAPGLARMRRGLGGEGGARTGRAARVRLRVRVPRVRGERARATCVQLAAPSVGQVNANQPRSPPLPPPPLPSPPPPLRQCVATAREKCIWYRRRNDHVSIKKAVKSLVKPDFLLFPSPPFSTDVFADPTKFKGRGYSLRVMQMCRASGLKFPRYVSFFFELVAGYAWIYWNEEKWRVFHIFVFPQSFQAMKLAGDAFLRCVWFSCPSPPSPPPSTPLSQAKSKSCR